jgi:DNA repair exonuclease SbcCD ATPase subunit
MSNPESSRRKRDSEVITLLLETATKHEKKMDQIVGDLEALKEDLSQNIGNLNKNLDGIIEKLGNLESDLKKIEQYLLA